MKKIMSLVLVLVLLTGMSTFAGRNECGSCGGELKTTISRINDGSEVVSCQHSSSGNDIHTTYRRYQEVKCRDCGKTKSVKRLSDQHVYKCVH